MKKIIKYKTILMYILILSLLGASIFTIFEFHDAKVVNEQSELGSKLLKEGDYDGAAAAFSKVIKIDKMNIDVRLSLSRAYIGAGESQKARQVLEGVSVDGKKALQAKALLAVAILEKGYNVTGDKSIKDALNDVKAKYASGNSIGNIKNGAWIAEKDGYIFRFRNGCLYRQNIDGSGKIKIGEGVSQYINIVDDWIYCVMDNYKLCKLKTDGKEASILYESDWGSLFDVNVVGDWIYFLKNNETPSGSACICSIRTDGTGFKKISDDYVYSAAVAGDYIFYTAGSQEDGIYLYKMKTDGSEKIKCSDVSLPWYIIIDDGWVYYINGSDNDSLYKMETDGSHNTKLSNDKVMGINVSGGFIYYIQDFGEKVDPRDPYYGKCSIVKIDKDGTGKTVLDKDILYYDYGDGIDGPDVCIYGDYIYYKYSEGIGESQEETKAYRMKTVGTGKQLLK